jgi:hypothetical protein
MTSCYALLYRFLICYVVVVSDLIVGKPFFNEVIFVHKPSKTLLCTDVYWNYPADVPIKTKLWKFGKQVTYTLSHVSLHTQHSTSRIHKLYNYKLCQCIHHSISLVCLKHSMNLRSCCFVAIHTCVYTTHQVWISCIYQYIRGLW